MGRGESAKVDGWASAWGPVIDQVGADLALREQVGADPVEAGMIRRFLEPVELGAALHYDPVLASELGYDALPAPVSSYMSFSLAPLWQPGEILFDSDDRNAMPVSNPAAKQPIPGEPHTSGFVMVNIEADYYSPACVGDRLKRVGLRLMDCKPRQTRLGRGAFITFETDIVREDGGLVAVYRMTQFRYEPAAEAAS